NVGERMRRECRVIDPDEIVADGHDVLVGGRPGDDAQCRDRGVASIIAGRHLTTERPAHEPRWRTKSRESERGKNERGEPYDREDGAVWLVVRPNRSKPIC